MTYVMYLLWSVPVEVLWRVYTGAKVACDWCQEQRFRYSKVVWQRRFEREGTDDDVR